MKFRRILIASTAVAVSGLGANAVAQDAQDSDNNESRVLDEVVVTGSFGRERTVADSAVPIDAFNEMDIANVSFQDTNDLLQTLIPSFTIDREPISDGAGVVRPAKLRGLPTDKTLVLVNSKRRHRGAVVRIGGAAEQGPDLSTIPAIALKSVEVLRDGAAAQYGSDAIAGVINFVLKDSSQGVQLVAQTGQMYEGDGQGLLIGANIGLPLGDDGFFNVTLEYDEQDRANRAGEYCEPWFCVPEYAAQPGNEEYAAAVAETVASWGQPEHEAYRAFVNMGYVVNENIELYGFGNYSDKTHLNGFFYRYPGNGDIEDFRRPDGSVWSYLEDFPGGYTPDFGGDLTDYSAVGGARGEFGNGIQYDVAARFGHNKLEYIFNTTVNPSLGEESPYNFRPGTLINEEAQVQLDMSKGFDVGLSSDLIFAFGASYLEERYEIEAGDPESYEIGPYTFPDPWDFCNDDMTPTAAGSGVPGLDCADPNDPVYRSFPPGSNGFPGYPPQVANDYERDGASAYVSLGADISTSLYLEAALRFENYSDFDSQTIFKIAGRYALTDNFAFRSSFGTGFRAPTPGQQGTTVLSNGVEDGRLVAIALYPASSPTALALGSSPLKPETSVNYSAGIVATFGEVSFTVDYYRIEVEDRLNMISTIQVVDDCDPSTPAIDGGCLAFRGNIIDAGVDPSVAASLFGVRFLTNAFDTITQGVDLVGTWGIDWSGGNTDLSFSANYNKTEYDGSVDELFNAESQFDFLNDAPRLRGNVTVNHNYSDFDFLARANFYGSYRVSDGGATVAVVQKYDPEVMIDLEASYTFLDNYRVSIGARNAFDNYPDKHELGGDQCCGRVYDAGTVVPWLGGHYYAKLTAQF